MTYDGHGRMKTRHYPIEETGANTTWSYNSDDSIQMVIDPRGVITNFAYYPTNGLVQTISYDVPNNSPIPDTPNVTFSYDNLGNRTQMTDGTGTATYAYNQLSQMSSETKTISGVAGNFIINYGYNLSGGLQSLSDPQNANQQVSYSFDKIGRATSAQMVSAGITLYSVFGTKYRAWGGIKEYQYGQQGGSNPNYLKYQYDARLNVSEYETGTQSLGMLERVEYQRYADGKLKFAVNSLNHKFDRAFKYTGIGTLQEGLSGRAANGDPNLNITDTPYRQNLIYNAFGEIDIIYGQYWGRAVPYYSTGLYPVSRDAAGNIVAERVQNNPSIQNRSYQWDAAGRQVQVTDPPLRSLESQVTNNTSYDGNGGRVKSEKIIYGQIVQTNYELKSTVLGGATVGTLQQNENGGRGWGFSAPAADGKISQSVGIAGTFESFEWTAPDGIKSNGAELDPRGAEVEEFNPYDNGGEPSGTYPARDDATNYARCAYQDQPISCSLKEKFDEYDRRRNSVITRIIHSGQRNAPTLRQGERLSKEELEIKRAIAATGKFDNEAEDRENVVDTSQLDDDFETVDIPKDFTDRIKKVLGTGDCNEFIRQVIEKTVENYNRRLTELNKRVGSHFGTYMPDARDGYELLDAVSKQGRFILENANVETNGIKIGVATVRGSIKDGDATVLLPVRYYHPSAFKKFDAKAYWQKTFVGIAVHELVHLAGNGVFGDQDLARAAKALGEKNIGEVEENSTNDDNKILHYSRVWNAALGRHCPGVGY